MKEKIWAFLCHFGYSMWGDQPDLHLRFERDAWEEITDGLREAGCSMIVLDIGEGIRLDTHPEIAVDGSWSKDEMRAELARLRGMGFEVIPKLNFSTTHDQWMGALRRRVSTPEYYAFERDVIREIAELFDHPRFFHIGYDEEFIEAQRDSEYVVLRQGELWWHDFEYLCECVESCGCRVWMWSDYLWKHEEEFLSRMPHRVLQSNYFYGSFDDKTGLPNEGSGARQYEILDRHGYEHVPCGYIHCVRENFPGTVNYGKKYLNDALILGYMQTVWRPTTREYLPKYMDAIEMFKKARQIYEN